MAVAEKMKKKLKSRAFLVKLIITILGCIFIPLLAVQIFVINESTEEVRKSNKDYYVSLLQGSAQTFASREQLLSQTALRMSLNEDIRKPLRHSATEYSVFEAAEAIGHYGAEILHVNTVGVYYISKGYVLTGGYKYLLEDYCEKIEPYSKAESIRMESFFRNLDDLSYYATSDGKSLYAARYVSLGAVGRNDAIVFFAMDAAALEESYRTAVACRCSVAVVDELGQPLVRGEDFVTNISAETLSNFVKHGSSFAELGGETDLLLYRYTDPESGVTFLLSADRDEAQEQLLDFAHMVRVTMYVTVLLIVISLLTTIHVTYRPIHQLLQKYTSNEDQDTGSEIERLDSALLKLDQETSTQQDLLTDFILGDLLFGNEVKPDLIARYFPRERYQFFVVLTVLCPALTTTQSLQLAEELKQATDYDVYVTSVPSRPHTVIACLHKHFIDTNKLQYNTVRIINEIVGEECPVCTGQMVQNISELRASYRSAVIVNMDPLKAEPGSNAGELAKKLQPLSQCVYMGDEEEALKCLDDIRQFLYSHTVGEGHLRYYGFKLLNAYLTSINNSQTQLSGQEVELLLSFTSMDHLFKLLSESIHQVCSQVADMEHIVDLQLQQRLLQYVDTHFMDSTLCLTSAADQTGASIYAVSRLFKEITGKGFKDYVTDKRLEYGHMLLCTTPGTIAEIATAAGFENANYFSTVFKAKYGLPPTKYRSELRHKKET